MVKTVVMQHVARLLLLLPVLAGIGCRQQMAEQPRYDPYEKSAFFDDQRSARHPVPGTVPRGYLQEDPRLHTGADAEGKPVNAIPLKLDDGERADFLKRGRERYNIFCSMCHGYTGEGNGIIVERGYVPPPSYTIERLEKAPLGYFYQVITKGYGAMPDYAAKIPPKDRWAIAAYIRALQVSHKGTLADLSDEEKKQLPPREDGNGNE